jgi:hypothetical protein
MNVQDMTQAHRIELDARTGWRTWTELDILAHGFYGARLNGMRGVELHIQYAAYRHDLVREN